MTNNGLVAGSNKRKGLNMKVTMLTTMAGPQGVCRAGRVLDLPPAQAKELVDGRFARDYRPEEDARRPVGMQIAKDKEE